MTQRSRGISIFVGLLLVAGGCGGGSGPTAPSLNVVEVAGLSFSLVNQARSSNQVEPQLADESELDRIAREYSERMRDEGFFAHVAPDGTTLVERLAETGIPYSYAGENLARVSGAGNPAAYAHQLLMQNPQHRGNILNSQFLELGVGVAQSGDTFWFTQIFLRPAQ